MFKKVKKENDKFVSKNVENYVSECLPKNVEDGHTDLSTFIPVEYSLLNEQYVKQVHSEFEAKVSGILETTDEFTPCEVFDSCIDNEIELLRTKHKEEAAMHRLSVANIVKAQNARKEELSQRTSELETDINETKNRVEALKDKHAKNVIRLGKKVVIQLGLPITVIALIVDTIINKGFAEAILTDNTKMIRIIVICLCLMSDLSMYALGRELSKKDKNKVFVSIFLTLFMISVVGSVVIRLGSMDISYASIDEDGNRIPKTNFSLAEYAFAVLSSLSTAVTGILSLYFSIDPEYAAEKECIKLRNKLEKDKKLYYQLKGELLALKNAKDPMILDNELRVVAEENLEILKKSLQLQARELLALHQKSADYLDGIIESSKELEEYNTFKSEIKEAV